MQSIGRSYILSFAIVTNILNVTAPLEPVSLPDLLPDILPAQRVRFPTGGILYADSLLCYQNRKETPLTIKTSVLLVTLHPSLVNTKVS